MGEREIEDGVRAIVRAGVKTSGRASVRASVKASVRASVKASVSVMASVSVRAGLDTRDDVEGTAQPCVTPQQCVGKVSFTWCGAVKCGGRSAVQI